MDVRLLLIIAACTVPNQGFHLNLNTRKLHDDNATSENFPGTEEEVRCRFLAIETCPQLTTENPLGGSGHYIVVDNQLVIPCNQSILEENRECAARGGSGCENYPYLDTIVALWEDLCLHEEELVENKDCLMSEEVQKTLNICSMSFSSTQEICLGLPNCVRSSLRSVQNMCSTTFPDLMYEIVTHGMNVFYGTNCERAPER